MTNVLNLVSRNMYEIRMLATCKRCYFSCFTRLLICMSYNVATAHGYIKMGMLKTTHYATLAATFMWETISVNINL